jgi:O-antigen/teichoic acid export membrane protein
VSAPDEAVLRADAGDRAVRGGLLRVGGYGLGLALTAAASVVLFRYLSVAEWGRYVVVIALLGIITGLSDAGLTVIGQRDYVRDTRPDARRAYLSHLLGLRLAITPVAIGAAVAFALIAGYGSAQVLGTLIAGAGLLFANAAMTAIVPLTAELRQGAVAAVDLVRQIALVGALVAFVLAGASLVELFWAYLLSGVAALAAALLVTGHHGRVAPRFDAAAWRRVARDALPIALALVINVIYLRALVLMVSLLSSDQQTGLFGTSYRVLEVFIGVPQLLAGAAFPILAHAGASDEARLSYVLQRLIEASLLLAAGVVLVLAIAAEPIVVLLGGEKYRAAGPILALQSAALLGAFCTQVWILGLIAVDRQRSVAVVNAVGLAVLLVLGLTLIPAFDAMGAAGASVAGELALAATAGWLLVRARPALRPSLRRPLRIVGAAAVAGLCAFLPVAPALAAALALAVYGGLVLALGAVPTELLQALRPGRSGPR